MRIKIICILLLLSSLFANMNGSYKSIEEDIKKATTLYKINKIERSKEYIKYARHHGYRNSGLEYKIRDQISPSKADQISGLFVALLDAVNAKQDINTIVTLEDKLLSALKSAIPKLKDQEQTSLKKDWHSITDEIVAELNRAKRMYIKGKNKQAIMIVQDTYFDIFENSGFENAILNFDEHRKLKAEDEFRVLISLMKMDSQDVLLKKEIEALKKDFEDLSDLLKPKECDCKSVIYYLSIGLIVLFVLLASVVFLRRYDIIWHKR